MKALPRPSSGYSETVCCAGISSAGEWKRLYPIRYRHGGEDFTRWDVVDFDYVSNPHDKRVESCKVLQGSIRRTGQLTGDRRRQLLEPLITSSTNEAQQRGRSLTAVRPSRIKFVVKKKPDQILTQEKEAYWKAAKQADMLDLEVEPFEPTPYMLGFTFADSEGQHTHQCGDWETHTTFRKWRQRYGEQKTLQMLKEKYEVEYFSKGLVLVLGTIAKRPKQWTLLGIVRLDTGDYQSSLLL